VIGGKFFGNVNELFLWPYTSFINQAYFVFHIPHTFWTTFLSFCLELVR